MFPITLIWCLAVFGTTAYAVFGLGHSGWWFLLALLLTQRGRDRQKGWLADIGLKPGDEVELSYVNGEDGEPKLIQQRIIRGRD